MFQIRDLRHAYDGADVLQIRDWLAEQGEHWLVLGPSGSGKTTLLHILAGILKPSFGDVLVSGQRLTRMKARELDRFRGRHVGIVLQQLHLVDSLTVRDNVAIAQYFSRVERNAGRVNEVLADLGLADRADAFPHELSFGQQQRVAVARAVVNRPTLLLADEPTSNLDDERCAQTLDLLETQAKACRATLVIATHDQRIHSRFGNQYVLPRRQ
ncbi:MAG TPA: ATP-binding cassette domain-containing protein [Burkholderiales bacterium]|nr:ATP-binding cassette domain-containing protein [Burkholderiales bacterium]